MGDATYIREIEQGRFSSAKDVTNAVQAMKQRQTRTIQIRIAADSAANSNVAEQMMHCAYYGALVTDVKVIPEANITAGNSTNYGAITIQSRDDLGGAALKVATVNFAVTNMVAYVTTAAVLQTNQLSVNALAKITIKHDKFGSGALQLPAYTVIATLLDV